MQLLSKARVVLCLSIIYLWFASIWYYWYYWLCCTSHCCCIDAASSSSSSTSSGWSKHFVYLLQLLHYILWVKHLHYLCECVCMYMPQKLLAYLLICIYVCMYVSTTTSCYHYYHYWCQHANKQSYKVTDIMYQNKQTNKTKQFLTSQIKQKYLPNLSILLSRGKETN